MTSQIGDVADAEAILAQARRADGKRESTSLRRPYRRLNSPVRGSLEEAPPRSPGDPNVSTLRPNTSMVARPIEPDSRSHQALP